MLESRACPNCHIGTLQPASASFVQWLGGGLVLVAPDQLAWVCDVCKESLYDEQAIMRIGLVLGQQMKRGKKRASAPRPDTDAGASGGNSKQRSVK